MALVGPEIEENLSLRYLAGALEREGIRCELFAFNVESDFPRVLESIISAPRPPLAVGLSLAFQWRAADFLALAVALRERGFEGHVTAGGHFATFACEPMLRDFPELDSVCRQEAEEVVVSLARALLADEPLHEVHGLALRTGEGVHLTPPAPRPELASIPLPDRRGEPARVLGHGVAPLVGSRGCYARCSYCCIAAWHEQAAPGRRYRLRDVAEVVDEMVSMRRQRGVDIFVFHDDNFFLPRPTGSLERIHALADALESRGIGPFASAVKARPPDLVPEVLDALRDRLHCVRTYVGIETDSDQGLVTLGRRASSAHNHEAIAGLRQRGMNACFNLLIFDPDTSMADLERNVSFMEAAADFPFCFGRVELYAGTPLLARMLAEDRARGSWMHHDYDLGSEPVERVFKLAVRCLGERNFGVEALVARLMGVRMEVAVASTFHAADLGPRADAITRLLSLDTAGTLRRILDHVATAPAEQDAGLATELLPERRGVDRRVERDMEALGVELRAALAREGRTAGYGEEPLFEGPP